MILNTSSITPELREESIRVAEDVFETQADQDVMQATPESFNKLKALSPDSILYEITQEGKLAGWVVVMPTSKELADKFVNKEIGEQALLDMTRPASVFDAVYLCAAATLPNYQRQGIALKLTKEALSRLPLNEDYEMYAWPTSEAGKMVLKKFEEETGRVIHIRK